MLVGKRPVRGDSPAELREHVTSHEARPLRQVDDGIPKELERICFKALAKRASAEPERISLSNLIGRGRDGNPNIILTNFTVVDVVTEKTITGRWTKVWIPVVPEGIPPESATAIP